MFEDGTAWIENTRLLLPAGATHVFGPLEPLPIDVDVVVERGPGIAYQALCTRDMASCFDDVAAGQPERIPRDLIVRCAASRSCWHRPWDIRPDGEARWSCSGG